MSDRKAKPLKGLFYVRTSEGRTQAELAKFLDITGGQYSRIERGITPITLERAALLADYLGITVDEML